MNIEHTCIDIDNAPTGQDCKACRSEAIVVCDFCEVSEQLKTPDVTRETMTEQGWSFGRLEDSTPETRCPYHAEVVST